MKSHLYETAGKVMGFFEAFKGSRPAINNNSILIVRGRSRNAIPIDEMDSKLEEAGKLINGVEVEPNSEKAKSILEMGDENIQETETVQDPIDNFGLSRMQSELESMGLIVKYKIFELKQSDVIIAIWEDKNEVPPLFVEVTVSNNSK